MSKRTRALTAAEQVPNYPPGECYSPALFRVVNGPGIADLVPGRIVRFMAYVHFAGGVLPESMPSWDVAVTAVDTLADGQLKVCGTALSTEKGQQYRIEVIYSPSDGTGKLETWYSR